MSSSSSSDSSFFSSFLGASAAADKRMKLLFNIEKMENLVEQAEAHVIVLLLGLFLLLLLLGGLSSGGRCSTTGGRGGTSSGSGADARPNVGDQGLEVGRLQSLGEEARPVGLNVNTSSLEDGGDLLGGDCDVIVSEDKGGVDAGKLRVGHLFEI